MNPSTIEPISCITIKPLRKRADFLRAKSGVHAATRTCVLQAIANPRSDLNVLRVGYTVTKRSGNAVERNRIKRRLRSAVQRVFPSAAKPGIDYVIIGKRQILRSEFDTLKNDIKVALDRVHSNRAKGNRKSSNVGSSIDSDEA